LYDEFLNSYETLAAMVVPRSALELERDEKYVLFRVFVFSKTVTDFKMKLREARFVPRDLEGISQPKKRTEDDQLEDSESTRPHAIDPSSLNPRPSSMVPTDNDVQDPVDELSQLQQELLMNFHYILSIVRTTYSETFMSYFHFKILKVLIEDVLRYGLPVNYTTFVVLPPPEKHKIDMKALKQTCLEFMEKYQLHIGELDTKKAHSKTVKEEFGLEANFSVSGIPQEYTANEYLPFVQEDVKWTT